VSAIAFEVEQAGCESCARRVRDALDGVVPVLDVSIDEDADLATVTVGSLHLASGSSELESTVNRALADASHGSGHAYRVRPGSWREA
jgi:copper chaperone CopZ